MIRARLTLIVVVVGIGTLVVPMLTAGAGASHVNPTEVSGNPTCGDFGNWQELRIQGVGNGSFSDGTLSVTISGFTGTSFNWSSNIGVDAVFVKGGPGGNLYRYAPEATSDSNLTPPINDNNNQPYGVSHISFCYDVEQTPPPTQTPTQQPTQTPTQGPTQTPTQGPTQGPPTQGPPTQGPTQTPTVGPTIIPTESPSVLPTRIESPSPDVTEQGSTPAPEASVQGRRFGELPFTGSGLGLLAAIGAIVAAAGGGLLYLRRR